MKKINPISLMERTQCYELWDEGSIPLWGNWVSKWLVGSRLMFASFAHNLDIEPNAVVAFLTARSAYAIVINHRLNDAG